MRLGLFNKTKNNILNKSFLGNKNYNLNSRKLLQQDYFDTITISQKSAIKHDIVNVSKVSKQTVVKNLAILDFKDITGQIIKSGIAVTGPELIEKNNNQKDSWNFHIAIADSHNADEFEHYYYTKDEFAELLKNTKREIKANYPTSLNDFIIFAKTILK